MTSLHSARPSTSDRPTNRAGRHHRRGANRPTPRTSAGSSRSTRTRPDTAALERLDAALEESARRPAPSPETFEEFGLPEPIVASLRVGGIVRPTAIQALTLPDALAGRDVLGRAQTGSGKTLGFGLPMLAALSTREQAQPGRPLGLVLVPTRELAAQVSDALHPVAGAVRRHVAVVVGGVSINRQIAELRRSVDVLVATPGRLLDLMDRRAVDLSAIRIAVLDEADHMADLGFLPAVTKILDATPRGRQCLLFSATLDRGVGRLVERYLHEPAVHAAGATSTPAAEMEHRVFVLEHDHKVGVATEIGARPGRTLFFVRTKHGADRLARQLTRGGVPSVAVHGNLNQNQRTRALETFASGRSRVLVATDVAARGLHIDDLDLVVHYDPPNDHKDYLHRSGRTARAGASGTVVSFVEPAQQRDVAKMHQAAAVAPAVTRVGPGAAPVREIARSGAPVEIREASPQHRAPSGQPAPRANRSNRRRGQGRARPAVTRGA